MIGYISQVCIRFRTIRMGENGIGLTMLFQQEGGKPAESIHDDSDYVESCILCR
jgi:hypothetical protein